MTPATDDGTAPILVGVRPSEMSKVHVKNLRYFSSPVCITSEPTEDGEPSTIWKFFQELAGHGRAQKIETIKILFGSGPACNCGAKKEGREGLRDPCQCPSGWATITFRHPDGAKRLTSRLDVHKRHHDSGAGPLGDRVDGLVNFCSTCCLFQRQVHVSRADPPLTAVLEVQPAADGQAVMLMPPQRLEALRVILSGLIQGYFPRDTDALFDSVDGSTVIEAERGIREEAETLIRRFCGRSNTVCEYLLDHYIKATAHLTPEAGLNMAYLVVNLLDDTEPGSSETVRELLISRPATEARIALIKKLAKTATEGWSPLPRESAPTPTASHSNAAHDRDVLGQENFSVENLTRALEEFREVLRENPPSKFVDNSVNLTVLESIETRVTRAFVKVTGVLDDADLPGDVETRHREDFHQLCVEMDFLLLTLGNEVSKAHSANGGLVSWGMDRTMPPRTIPPSDGPTAEEIDHEVSLFTGQVETIGKMADQCDTLLKGANIHRQKHRFLNLKKELCPLGSSAIKELAPTITLFSKWIASDGAGITGERLRSLHNCVDSGREMRIRWQRLLFQMMKVDQKFGFSQASTASAATPPTRIEIDTYWGGQAGKPFQNLVEWIAELEDKLLRHFPSHQDRIEQTLAHLSPNVVSILKTHKFSTYEELKDWLLEYYLDKQRIMDDWVKQLNDVGSSNKHMTSAQVGLYVTQVRGILKQILEFSSTTIELKRRLFTTQSVAHLGRVVLIPLKQPTGKDQWVEFTTSVYAKLKAEAASAKTEVKPEVLLKHVEDWLESIKVAQKAKADLTEEARLGGFRGPSGAGEFERKMQHQVRLLEEDGNDYPDIFATAAGILCGSSSNTPPGTLDTSTNPRGRRRNRGGKLKSFSHVQVQTLPLTPGWGAGILWYQVT